MNSTATNTYIARPQVKGQGFVVLVHRHDNPEGWGVHEVFLREATKTDRRNRFDDAYAGLLGLDQRAPRFNQTTVGLFPSKPELVLQGFNPLTVESIIIAGAGKPAGVALVATHEFNALMEYIGDQIIPLEWKEGWANDHPSVRSRVEVWV